MSGPEETPGGPGKPPEYRRPEMPFERKATVLTSAYRWSAAGLEFGASVVLFFLGGRALDANLGTGPWLSVAGALFGVAVGTWMLIRAALRTPSAPSPGGGSKGPGSPRRDAEGEIVE